MLDPEVIEQQQRLLTTYRQRLVHLVQQQAQYGEHNTPPEITRDMANARLHIANIKQLLRDHNVEVLDQPVDRSYITQRLEDSIVPTRSTVPQAPQYVPREQKTSELKLNIVRLIHLDTIVRGLKIVLILLSIGAVLVAGSYIVKALIGAIWPPSSSSQMTATPQPMFTAPTPTFMPKPVEMIADCATNTDMVNARQGPTISAPVIEILPSNVHLTAIGRDMTGEWVKVAEPKTNRTYWINRTLLHCTEDPTTLPTVPAP